MKRTHYLLLFFLTEYPKRCSVSSRCGPFEAEHSNTYQNHLFNPLMVQEAPPPRSIYLRTPFPSSGDLNYHSCLSTYSGTLINRLWNALYCLQIEDAHLLSTYLTSKSYVPEWSGKWHQINRHTFLICSWYKFHPHALDWDAQIEVTVAWRFFFTSFC